MVRLTPGFRIEPREMYHLARFFVTISGEYRSALPQVIGIPQGGSAGIDRAMATTLKTINEMHTVLCEAIEKHSGKLRAAHDNYVAIEISNGDDARQVQKAIEAGESAYSGESVVVGEYLGGARPAYLSPAPTQPVSIYGQKKGQGAGGKPALAKIPEATEVTGHRSWVQFQYQIITFDYRGLWHLVDELNAFIQKGDPLIIQLAKRVADFCSPYQNYGDAVYQFNATFSEDASLASGFHKVISTISATIDNFANGMAKGEAWLEHVAHQCNVPDSFLAQMTQGRNKEQLKHFIMNEAGTKRGNIKLFLTACLQVMRQAENLRRQAASQLIILSETITSGGLDYYTKKDTHLGSADPGGLFNDGTSPHAGITRQLEAELAGDGKLLKNSPDDVKKALSDISKLGGYGGQIGGVMGGVESVKKSENLFQAAKNIGNLAGTAGPVIETLGLLVFAE